MYASVDWVIISLLNTLRPRQNGRHFADDTFKPIFLNENIRISIKMSLKFADDTFKPIFLNENIRISIKISLKIFFPKVPFAREKHYQKIAIPIFRLVLQNFALPVAFLAFFPSLSFLLTFFWLGCYCSMWLYFSSGN